MIKNLLIVTVFAIIIGLLFILSGMLLDFLADIYNYSPFIGMGLVGAVVGAVGGIIIIAMISSENSIS